MGITLNHGIAKLGVYELYQAFTSISSNKVDWHHRLGHPSTKIMNVIHSHFTLDVPLTIDCNSCNKSHRLSLSISSIISIAPLRYIFTDLWTSPIHSHDNYKYYVIFVDHFFKYIWFYPLKNKFDTSKFFVRFKALVENYFQRSIIHLNSDNGGEYEALREFLTINGISHLTTPPHTLNTMVFWNDNIGTLSKLVYLSSLMPQCHSHFGPMLLLQQYI